MKRLYFFCLAGGCGFIADYFVFTLISSFYGAYLAKFLGFICAVQITYYVNKTFTFFDKEPNYIIYIIGQTKGFIINYIVFSIIYYYTQKQQLGFFAAAGITLLFNYYYAKYFAFKS